jgi:hypothetical protein
MQTLRKAMEDPALGTAPSLLGELFNAMAEEPAAHALLAEIPTWKVPGLLLSAAFLFRAASRPGHPLAPWLADPCPPLGDAFRRAFRQTLADDRAELSALVAAHTYQCNPPRRMAVTLVALAACAGDLGPAWHIDVGTASGIGLLLGAVRVTTGGGLGPANAALEYPLELRGAPLNLAALMCPKIERSIGIDLDPPDLRDPACRAWMRACQFPLARELAFFDRAVDCLIARDFRIERGSAIDVLPALHREIPQGKPLLVTDTYVSLFMTEDDREKFRRQLDAIAQHRPLVWISNNSLVPPGPDADRTTAGTTIPPQLRERNARELFGAVCVTTWPNGQRTPRLIGLTHPSACWFEWRPDLG